MGAILDGREGLLSGLVKRCRATAVILSDFRGGRVGIEAVLGAAKDKACSAAIISRSARKGAGHASGKGVCSGHAMSHY